MESVLANINYDNLIKILIIILKNSKDEDEYQLTKKHIEICVSHHNNMLFEYNKYKEQRNLRNELVKLIDTYIQYGKNSIEFYKKNKDICYESSSCEYSHNKYDPDNKWCELKKYLSELDSSI